MPRYIDADEIQYTMLYKENWITNTGVEKQGVWKDDIDKMPTADVRENVRGEWIEITNETGEWLDCEVVHDRKDAKITDWQQARCSICGKWHTTPYMYNWNHFDYCPNCGADMKGGTTC